MRLYFIPLVLILTGLSLGGCSSKEETSQQYLSKALQYHQQGKDNAAIIELKNAIQKNPKNGQARYLMAVIHIARGEGAAAEIELKKAEGLGVSKEKVEVALGQALLLQGEYQKVLDKVKPPGAEAGKMASAIFTARGNAFLGLGKADNAEAAFKKALHANSSYADAYLGMARLAVSEKNLKEALHQTEMALLKSPKSTLAWSLKGDLSRMQNKADDARAAYSQVLKIDKDNIPARISLAAIDMGAGKIDAAKSEIESAEKIKPKSLRVKYMRALLEATQGKYTEARDSLQQVMKSASDYMPGVLLSGVISYELGSYEQANKDLSRFLFQFPSNVYAARFLVAADMKQNNLSDAIKHVQTLVAHVPHDPDALALAGQIYMQAKDYGKATEYIEKAVHIEPKNAQLRTQLGASRLAAGDRRQAIQDLASAIKLDSKQFGADSLLMATHLENKEYAKALDTAKNWQKRQPDNPVIYNLKGAAYLGKGDRSNARKSFEEALTKKADYFPAAMNLARLDLQDKNFASAKKRLEGVLKADKTNLSAMLALGGLADAAGKGSEAVAWLEKAIKSHPSVLQPRKHLAEYYLRHSQPKKALQAARDAVSANASAGDALMFLGDTQVAVGDRKGALETYSKLADMSQDSPLVQFKLAQVQEATNHPDDAESSLKKALALKPDFLDAKVALATLRAMSGHYKEALKMASQISSDFPKSSAGLSLEGDVLMMRKDYLEAAKAYQGAYDIAGSGALAAEVHDAYALAGKRRQGQQVLLRRLEDHPNDIGTRFYLAQSYLNEHRNKPAILQYQAVLKQQPDNVFALNNLAWLYLQEKNPGALGVARKAYKLDPKSPEAADTLGWALVGKGQVIRGRDILEKAVTLAHGNPSVSYHYAVALAKTGDKAKARRRLKELLASGRHFAEEKDAEKLLKHL